MNRGQILDEAKRLTLNEREAIYGTPLVNHQRIAKFWSIYLEHEVTPQDVALMMALVKVARLIQTPDHLDSVIDLCSYGSIAGELSQ
tara:strand:+ start:1106 stop:1366 length:261 start_codon:yes stop_codon:yes gene_type:complete